MNTGATDLIATVPGPSGPVAIDPVGNLHYGEITTLFPNPTGRTYYWTDDQVAGAIGPTSLTDGDATGHVLRARQHQRHGVRRPGST